MAENSDPDGPPLDRSRSLVLLASVFVVAAAGLVYELIAATLSTYLLGSSITVFSIVIGVFLSAMGLGAYLAKYVRTEIIRAFILAEIVLAFIGGLSPLLLFSAFAATDSYPLILVILSVAVGALVGIEIPLLLRILEKRVDVRTAVSHVLALDYVGALLGSLAFPLLLLPFLGLVRTGALFGLLNLAVAFLALSFLADRVPRARPLRLGGALVGVILLAVMLGGARATTWLEDRLYSDPIVLAKSTPYQRIVVTRWRDDVRLFIDGNLQFSSVDEYRYHESLVHPAMSAAKRTARILILGGGDGLAVREVFKHPGVKHVDLVDLDPAITDLFRDHPALSKLNGGVLRDPRVTVHNVDAVRFLEDTNERWDVILMDLPDPNDAGLARLYAEGTFRLARRRLHEGGALATQATSPFYAPEAFWCIVRTVESAFGDGVPGGPRPLAVRPYHVHVPSFGEWGFVLASADSAPPELPPGLSLRYLNAEMAVAMFQLPADLARRDVEVNRLATAVLARYYERGYRTWHGP
jgi:spermidine synthase